MKDAPNRELRQYAKDKHVYLWRIADDLGVSEMTLTRWLRKPLNAEQKQMYISIIDRLAVTHYCF